MVGKKIYAVMTDQAEGPVAFLLKIFLRGLSYIYFLIISLMDWCYEKKILSVQSLKQPVVCFGNLTMGGTGKTPLVECVAKYLSGHGKKLAILTRGYAIKDEGLSDEVEMLKTKLKNVSLVRGKNRFDEATQFLKKKSVDIFLMDDGFQHRKLFRDLNVLVVDAMNPWGNGFLIPRGILREPQRAMKRADVYVLTKVNMAKDNIDRIKQVIQKYSPAAPIFETMHLPKFFINIKTNITIDLLELKRKNIVYICAIGNPDSFSQSLLSLGCIIKGEFRYRDHHIYQMSDIDDVVQVCNTHGVLDIVTTAKDAVKLKKIISKLPKEINIYSLEMEISFVKEEGAFFERIDSLL